MVKGLKGGEICYTTRLSFRHVMRNRDQEVLKEEAYYNNVVGEEVKNRETFSYVPRFQEARIAQNQYGTNLAWQGGYVHLGKLYEQDTMGVQSMTT